MQSRGVLWAMMILIVGLNTVAQALLKAGAGRGLINGALVGGVAAYGLSTLVYVMILGRMNLSFAYPVIIGATMVASCLVGAKMLRETVLTSQWLGIALIIVGITVVALGGKATGT